jgi:predicted NBD/HSP70 family sugar kinase
MVPVQNGRTTVRDVRRSNRAILLNYIYHAGPLSRHELVNSTSLSQASVSNLVTELIDEGLVEEAGLVGSDGGRPRVLLRVAAGHGFVVGAQIEPARTLVELYDLALHRHASVEFPADAGGRDPEMVQHQLTEGLRRVLERGGVDGGSVIGLGVGVSGAVEGPDAVVHAPTLGWEAVPLGALLRARTGLAVHVNSGIMAAGKAEMWFGAGRGAKHAVIAHVGTGVVAAVVVDRRSYGGVHSCAGEWGHTTLVYNGRSCRCGGRGCLEAYIRGDAILDRFRERATPGEASAVRTLAELVDAEHRSRAAAAVLAETIGYLGAGIGNLINLLNPDRIVLGGWAGFGLGERFLPQIRAAAARQALRRPFARTSIELCRLGRDAVAKGAATVPISRLLADGGLRGVGAPALIPRPYRRRAGRGIP